MLKQAESKWDGVINTQNYSFNQFEHGNIQLFHGYARNSQIIVPR